MLARETDREFCYIAGERLNKIIFLFFGAPVCIFFTIWFEKFKLNYYKNLKVNVLATVTSVKGSRKKHLER